MKKRTMKFISLILCLAAIISCVVISSNVFAAEYSTGFPNTHSNTGEQNEDICEVAKTQIGYVESGSNHTKYNAWMGDVTGSNMQGTSWCAMFVAWCANQAGVDKSVIPSVPGVTALFNSFSANQVHYASDGYTPKKGDICFFAYSTSTAASSLAHVGLVYSTNSDSTINIIEGNCSDKVQMLKRPFFGYTFGQYIVSYATPDYKTNKVMPTGISLPANTLTLNIGESFELIASVLPSNAEDKTVKFKSSNSDIVTVDSKGVIKGIKKGTAKITAETSNGKKAVCNVTVKEASPLVSIGLQEAPEKTIYFLWDEFEPKGIKVIATYSDGSRADVTARCTYDGVSTYTVGTKNACAVYTEGSVTKSIDFNIFVVAKLKSIAAVSSPSKKTYLIGDKFNDSGLKIVAKYNDTTIKEVTPFCTLSGFNSDKAGTNTVSVSYSENGVKAKTSFDVEIINGTTQLSKIEVIRKPTKLIYLQDEPFLPDGLAVKAVYSDGSSEIVTSKCILSNSTTSLSGTQKVSVMYQEGLIAAMDYFNITVLPRMTKISVVSAPKKTQYIKGESFDRNGLKIIASYSDGTTKDVTNMCIFTGFDSSKTGAQTITASYRENGVLKTATFEVSIVKAQGDKEVKTLKRIKVFSHSFVLRKNKKIDNDKFGVVAQYSDSSTENITSKVQVICDTSKSGFRKVIVKYTENGKEYENIFYVLVLW